METRTDLQWLAVQLRALKDGGISYTLDDLLDAIERSHGMTTGTGTPLRPGFPNVIEQLQMIVSRRARKAA